MKKPLPKWVPGREAAHNLHVARTVVRAWVDRGPVDGPAPHPDVLKLEDLPSTAILGPVDRVIGEIDQDGYVFVEHPEDALLFRQRKERLPKERYGLHIVARNGRVCIRKRFSTGGLPGGLAQRFWHGLGLPFYFEAAALSMLEHEPQVPTLREVAVAERTVYMDYVQGDNLRHLAAAKGYGKLDLDVMRESGGSTADSIDYEAMESEFGPSFLEDRAPEVKRLIEAMRSCGVLPLDIKLGNLIAGHRTQSLHWVDFERACLKGFLNYEVKLEEQARQVERIFGLRTA